MIKNISCVDKSGRRSVWTLWDGNYIYLLLLRLEIGESLEYNKFENNIKQCYTRVAGGFIAELNRLNESEKSGVFVPVDSVITAYKSWVEDPVNLKIVYEYDRLEK